MKTDIVKTINSMVENEVTILERTARNCDFYKENGMTEHYINEVGCLRGIMYALEEIGIPFPCYSLYYNMYIKPVADKMNDSEPLHTAK